LSFVESQTQGAAGVDGLVSPTKVVVSPDGQNVYVACYGSNAVVVFRRDATTGALKFVETQRNGVGGVTSLRGAYDVAVSPDGENVYVVTEDDDSLVVFSRNATTGALTFVEAQRNGIDGVDGLFAAKSVRVSLDGHHVYAVGYDGSSIAVFSRSATTGTLKYVQVVKDGVNGVTGLSAPNSVDLSPDGRNVYAVAAFSSTLTAFARDTNTGMLSLVELHKQGINGVDGLNYAYCVRISSDGRNVYAVGTSSNAVAVFRRSTTTGTLTFLEVLTEGIGGVDGLASTKSLWVSPNGEYVYVAGSADNAVAVFRRDQQTGALTFVEAQKNGINGVSGLTWAYGVTVSPDNQNIYATGLRDNAIVVFRVAPSLRRRAVRGAS
jgi:6-phosphogluconolactonase (cycloisomerase 2 family)